MAVADAEHHQAEEGSMLMRIIHRLNAIISLPLHSSRN